MPNQPQYSDLFILEAYDSRQLGRHQTTDLLYNVSELLKVLAELGLIEALTTGLCNLDKEDHQKGPIE